MSCTNYSRLQSIVQMYYFFGPLFLFIKTCIEMLDKLIRHTQCVGTRLCIRSHQMCQLTTPQQVFLFRDILCNVITPGAGTTYPSGAPEVTPFSGTRVARSLVFSFAMVLSVPLPSIYVFSLLHCYLQTCLIEKQTQRTNVQKKLHRKNNLRGCVTTTVHI